MKKTFFVCLAVFAVGAGLLSMSNEDRRKSLAVLGGFVATAVFLGCLCVSFLFDESGGKLVTIFATVIIFPISHCATFIASSLLGLDEQAMVLIFILLAFAQLALYGYLWAKAKEEGKGWRLLKRLAALHAAAIVLSVMLPFVFGLVPTYFSIEWLSSKLFG